MSVCVQQFTQGSALQRYNSELTRYIENIRTGRDELHEEIGKDEEEKQLVEGEIAALSERLAQLSDALIRKYEAREEFERTISETEQAFMKILESSQTLLHVLKKEDSALNKRKLNVSTRRSGTAVGNKENYPNQLQQSPLGDHINKKRTTSLTKAKPHSQQQQQYQYNNSGQKQFGGQQVQHQ